MATRTQFLEKLMRAKAQDDSRFLAARIAPYVDVEFTRAGRPSDDAPVEYKFDYKAYSPATNRGVGATDITRAIGSQPVTLPDHYEDKSGKAVERSLQHKKDLVNWQEAMSPASRTAWDREKVEDITQALLIKREEVLVSLLDDTSVFQNYVDGSAANYFDDDSNDPLDTLVEGAESVNTYGNGRVTHVVLDKNDAKSILFNAGMSDRYGDAMKSIQVMQDLIRDNLMQHSDTFRDAASTNLEVLIGSATKRTDSMYSSSVTPDYVWSGVSAMLSVPENADLEVRAPVYHANVQDISFKIFDDDRDELHYVRGRMVQQPFECDYRLAYVFRGMTQNPFSAT